MSTAVIPEATADLRRDGLYARSRYSFRRLAATLSGAENREPLVSPPRTVAEKPFWEQNNDIEGACYQEYIQTHPDFALRMRKGVADRLDRAAALLPADWRIVVKAGYRPVSVQKRLLAALQADIRSRHPNWSSEVILEHARTFVSDPSIATPPHCTGAAIDIDVLDRNGAAVDMGCPPNTDSPAAFTHHVGLTDQQRRNRKQLLQAMFEAGFANLAYEWWHFSYGDRYWAAFYGHPNAIYGVIDE